METFNLKSNDELNELEDARDLDKLWYYFQQVEVELHKVRKKTEYLLAKDWELSDEDEEEYERLFLHLKQVDWIIDWVRFRINHP